MQRLILVTAGFALLSACSSITKFGNSFEGAQDFRIVPPLASDNPADWALQDCKDRMPITEEGKGAGFARTVARRDEAFRTAISLGCYTRFQMHPANNQKLVEDTSFFKQGDNIAISLKAALINQFTEGWLEQTANSIAGKIGGPSPVKGEVAIVANVTQQARSPGGRNGEGQLEGKVVYYGNDIYKGQTANEFNIPVYGPLPWTEGPLTIDLWVLELDQQENKEFGSILATLASLATRYVGLPSTGDHVLNQVGTSFLKSNKDDIIGHFTVTLVPPTVGLKLADSLLRVSDIIIHREEGIDRGQGVAFDHCYYDPLQTKVYCDEDKNSSTIGKYKTPGRNSLILSVRKSPSNRSMVAEVNLEELNQRLSKADGVSATVGLMDEVSDRWGADALLQSATKLVTRIADTETSAAVREFDAAQLIAILQCAVVAETRGRADTGQAAYAATEAGFATYCGDRAFRRSLGMDQFNQLSRHVIQQLNVTADQLSREALIGSGEASNLAALRTALASSFVPKPVTMTTTNN